MTEDELIAEAVAQPGPVWSVVANIITDCPSGRFRPDQEVKRGTKHFRPGTKVYLIYQYGWIGGNVEVLGLHRGSRRFAQMVVPMEYLTNWRVKLVYNPLLISQLGGNSTNETKEKAERAVAALQAYEALHNPKIVTIPLFTGKEIKARVYSYPISAGRVININLGDIIYLVQYAAASSEAEFYRFDLPEGTGGNVFEHIPYEDSRFFAAVKYLQDQEAIQQIFVKTKYERLPVRQELFGQT